MGIKTGLTALATFGLMAAFSAASPVMAEDASPRLPETIDREAAQCGPQQSVLSKLFAENYRFIFDFSRVNMETRQFEAYSLLAQPQTRNWTILQMKGPLFCTRHTGTNLSYTVVEPDSIIPVKGVRSFDPESPCDVFLLKSTMDIEEQHGNLLYTGKKEDGANLQIFRDARNNWLVAVSSETPDKKCHVETLTAGRKYQQHDDEMEKVFGYFALNPKKFPLTPS